MTAIDVIEAIGSFTVTEAAPTIEPCLARTMCATHVPPGHVDATAVARPPETVSAPDVAPLGVMASQTVSGLAVRSHVAPLLYVPVATNAWVVPLLIVSGPAGVSEMLTRVPAPNTVTVTVGEVTPPKLAVMVAVPIALPITSPVEDTLAMAGEEETHDAVPLQSVVVPLLNVSVHVNGVVPPIGTAGGALGVMAMLLRASVVTITVVAALVFPPHPGVESDALTLATPVVVPVAVLPEKLRMPAGAESQATLEVTSRVDPDDIVAMALNVRVAA